MSPRFHVGKFEARLVIAKGDFKAYQITIICTDEKFLGVCTFDCILETYDCSLEEIKERKIKAKQDIQTLKEMGALEATDPDKLVDEVNDLFNQTFFKKRD